MSRINWQEYIRRLSATNRANAKHTQDIVLDISGERDFWSGLRAYLEICKPIMHVLCLVDSAEVMMGIIYQKIEVMQDQVMTACIDQDSTDECKQQIRTFCRARCLMLHSPLHSIGFLLNPRYANKVRDNVIISGKLQEDWLAYYI